MKRMYVLAIALGALALSAIPRAASAQKFPQVRHGFWFSGGLGYGSLGCHDCSRGFAALTTELSIGGTISDHVLLGVGTNQWTGREYYDARIDAGTISAITRIYPRAQGGFFITAGLGLGALDYADNETGGGAVLGAGYDFRAGRNISLTPYYNIVGMTFKRGNAHFYDIGLAITTH